MTRPGAETGADGAAQARLLAHLTAAGYAPVTPPVLQPIEPFLELSGEDIRRRISECISKSVLAPLHLQRR